MLNIVVLLCPDLFLSIPVSVAFVNIRLGPLIPDKDVAGRGGRCQHSSKKEIRRIEQREERTERTESKESIEEGVV